MNGSVRYQYFDSPLGSLLMVAEGGLLTRLYLPNHKGRAAPAPAWQKSDKVTEQPFEVVRKQLAEYFAGQRCQFDLPLGGAGTPFQQRVWQELVRIPFGTTVSYGELAERIGQPQASRAVGNANGRNPISIIVPCHRVIGSSGKLTGYAGGLRNKRWLLDWERSQYERSESRQGYFADFATEASTSRSPSMAATSGKS